jgi:hypothetical protein
MATSPAERRSCKRTKVSWQVEYTSLSSTQGLIHEASRLVDYSELGACLLTMSQLEIGMELAMHVSLPVRMARPLEFKGFVVRVKEDADVVRLFKEVGVRWQPSFRTAQTGRVELPLQIFP